MQDGIFSSPLEITHLVLRWCNWTIFLWKCQNLKKFELRNSERIYTCSLERIIRDNSMLQSLSVYNVLKAVLHREIIMYIAEHLKHIKELAIVDNILLNYGPISESNEIDGIVNSFRHLESLAITFGFDSCMIELLQRLGKVSGRIKHLELHQKCIKYTGYEPMALVQVIPSFKQIHSLHLSMTSPDANIIGSAIKHLSNLRHLYLCISTNNENFSICSSLVKITIDSKAVSFHQFGLQYFLQKYIETGTITGKSNVQIDMKDCGQLIGKYAENGLIWRN